MRKNVKTVPKKPVLQFDPAKKRVLHVECGPLHSASLPKQFLDGSWQEIRMDSRASSKADITASLTKMTGIAAQQFHAIFISPGMLERLYPHEVVTAFQELCRILIDGGLVFCGTFDIQKIAEFVAKGNLERPLFNNFAAIDMLYGQRPALQAGNLSVSQNTAFTAGTLATKFAQSGFGKVQVRRDGANLWALAYKVPLQDGKSQVDIIEEDVNQMMRRRDELDKKPEIPVNLPGF